MGPVVAAFKLHDLSVAGHGARESNRVVGRLEPVELKRTCPMENRRDSISATCGVPSHS